MKDKLTKHFKKASFIIDSLFPAICISCRKIVGRYGSFCSDCWQNIHFITNPFCYKCGVPFGYDIGDNALCGRCMQQKPAYTLARSVFKYDEFSRNPVLSLKYHDRTQLAPIFAEWLAKIAKEYSEKAAAIIPVPLHYTRLVKRRYNQAVLLSGALSQELSLPTYPDLLRRIKKTPSQAGLSQKQRHDNMRGAFKVKKEDAKLLKGKSVILIDDVMTTGATLEACSRTLHDAGVIDIYVLTLARTVLMD